MIQEALLQDIPGPFELEVSVCTRGEYRGSYMSAHVLLNLLNELRKSDKMQGLPSILSLLHNKLQEHQC